MLAYWALRIYCEVMVAKVRSKYKMVPAISAMTGHFTVSGYKQAIIKPAKRPPILVKSLKSLQGSPNRVFQQKSTSCTRFLLLD